MTIDELKKLPIVMLSMSRWDSPISSASWSLAQEFAKSQPVFYVDYPYTFLDYRREKDLPSVKMREKALLGKGSLTKELASNLWSITPPLMYPINWLPSGIGYNTCRKLNNKKLAASIEAALKIHGLNEFILWNSFNPIYLSSFKSYFKPAISIYHSRDAIGAINDYTKKHGVASEIEAIRNYDLAIGSSTKLASDLSILSGKDVHLFANGGNIELFAKAWKETGAVPEEMKHIPKPIIGYAGNVCQRQDYLLLEKIALEHRDKSLVFIGPREDHLHTDIQLEKYPNVYFLGPKKLQQLPDYLRYFDCAIIPFLRNDLTESIYPLKINEYLAAGQSVVTTNFSDDIAAFKEVIWLANNHGEFLKYLSDAIANQGHAIKEARWKASKNNSWEIRVQSFWELVKYQLKIN
ncbi:glycosyltransferase [Mongoliitalea daihaiensis]|uniref:glycosyltransferase n=1 Tax=Mongoliitalea daihaiensis TaxID=2782006 RepID=UPI001F42E7EF|nr:glycosyltransferase [Mongoliitalea daihaiensis]UJP64519.1 glycosyltransferase [Mongoliitalea daihaiensis]